MKRVWPFRQLTAAACALLGASQFVTAQTCDETWQKADNPHVISGTVTIPAGRTVCIEPGVHVEFASDGKLHLFGSLIGAGGSADRITFMAPASFPNRIEIAGTLDLRFADISVVLNVNAGGSFFGRDCNFGRFGLIASFDGLTSHLDTKTRFVFLENSVFDSNEPTQSANASIFGANFTATSEKRLVPQFGVRVCEHFLLVYRRPLFAKQPDRWIGLQPEYASADFLR